MEMKGLPPRGGRAGVLMGLGAFLSAALLLAVSSFALRGAASSGGVQPQYTFVPVALGTVPRFGARQALPEPSAPSTPSSGSSSSTASPQVFFSGLGCVLALVVSAASRRPSRGADTRIIRQAGNSKTGGHSRGDMGSMGAHFFKQSRSMFVEETVEPTELPYWQRDMSYAWLLQQREMREAYKRGQKVYWQVRCLGECYYQDKFQMTRKAYKVEVMASGLEGRIPLAMAGSEPLETGKIYWTECIRVPWKLAQPAWTYENLIWPVQKRYERAYAEFSVRHYQESMEQLKLARLHSSGEVVEGTILKKVLRGFMVKLDSGLVAHWPLGYISRAGSASGWQPNSSGSLKKTFPPGARIKAIVKHSDHDSGRVVLSTKEFEDDEHIGWMNSFPERLFANAEERMQEYFRKKERYIEWLQETEQRPRPHRGAFAGYGNRDTNKDEDYLAV